MSGHQEEILNNFVALTGTDRDTAVGFLDAAGWDMETATSLYFDAGEQQAPAPVRAPAVQPAAAAPPARQTPADAPPEKKPKVSQPTSRIRTFADLGGHESDEEEDDEENTYYAGGEKSGIQVKASASEIAKRMAESARRQAMEGLGPAAPQKQKPTSNAFAGSGYRLGSLPDEDRTVPAAAVKPALKKPDEEPKEVTKALTLYRNGFTVDDGPLRTLDDPANQRFLADVYRGVIPIELEKEAGKAIVNLTFLNKEGEEYVPPKATLKPFSGAGFTLGSSTAPPAPAPAPAKSSAPAYQLAVDPSKPTTSIQIRLHDGTRLVARFNQDHTVQDLRRFVEAAQPVGRAFNLMTPPRQLITNESQTLAQAGLLNSVVIQSLS